MNDDRRLEEQLAVHRELRGRLSHVWAPFFGSFGALRPVQIAAAGHILDRQNLLLTAPTAGGKTEAVLAPICQRLLSERWDGLSTVVVTPTRALVNDLFLRLSIPCDRLGMHLARKTADHSDLDAKRTNLLMTTPESLESLLTFRRRSLASVRAVVLDEIHLLDGSPRGDQLRLVMQRLKLYLRHVQGDRYRGLQRVAMSATVADPHRLAKVYLGEAPKIVSVGGQRELESHIIQVDGTESERAEAAVEAAARFPDARKILVFVNSRRQVDVGCCDFRCGLFKKAPVYGHHGNLSKDKREEVEARFKAEPFAVCVATMTLEVGIDIGDIDLIICMDPPFSLSSFLQRIGRGCRRRNGATRVVCVARDRTGELIFRGLVKQAAAGMPAGPVAPFRRSVLVQQILAYLKQVPRNVRTAEHLVAALCSTAEPSIPESMLREVLEDMLASGLVARERVLYQPGSAGWEFIESNRIYSNIQFTGSEVELVDVDTGRVVGRISGEPPASRGVKVAGRSYDLVDGGSSTQRLVRSGGEHEQSPRYASRSLPYAYDIGASLAGELSLSPDTLYCIAMGGLTTVMTWLGRMLNGVLALGIRQCGPAATAGTFHIEVDRSVDVDWIALLQRGIAELSAVDSELAIEVSRSSDLGRHFRMLSDIQQRRACHDWMDLHFLDCWVRRLKQVQRLNPGEHLADDCLELAR